MMGVWRRAPSSAGTTARGDGAARALGWLGLSGLLALSGCVTRVDIPAYAYACTHGLSFQARLYSDMAVLEGGRGHDTLKRQKDGPDGSHVYGAERLLVTFGLGVDRRLATLRYVDIPQTIHCERVHAVFGQTLEHGSAGAAAAALPPLEVSKHAGPKAPEPPAPVDPRDRVYTNIITGDGDPGAN